MIIAAKNVKGAKKDKEINEVLIDSLVSFLCT